MPVLSLTQTSQLETMLPASLTAFLAAGQNDHGFVIASAAVVICLSGIYIGLVFIALSAADL